LINAIPGDIALPAMSLAFDFESLATRFSEACDLDVKQCRRLDTKYVPGQSCVVVYWLSGIAASRRVETIGVVEVDRNGIRHRSFIDDPALPGLREAIDGERVRVRLGGTSSCRVTPVRHKPGVSCVLRYTIADNDTELFAKAFARGSERQGEILRTLARAMSPVPAVPMPVADWVDLQVVVAESLPGRPLGAAVWEPAAFTAAGRAMSAFHREVRADGAARTLHDDVAELPGYRPLFVRLAPDLADRVDACVRELHELEVGTSPVPSHGALRADQVVIDGAGRVGLLDLDGFCWADPARDYANLVGYLEWRSIREPASATLIERALAAWRDGYVRGGGTVDPGSLAAFRSATLLKIAGRCLRSLRTDEWDRLAILVDRAETSLGMLN
jgi:hypothetical protein